MENESFFKNSQDGLERVIEETANFDRIAKGVYEITAREIYGSIETPGLALFSYGSPGRIELIGGDSDADIFLAEKKRTSKTKKFRKIFKERFGTFDFSKVDLTEWGTYEEIETYLDKSLVEGNQILETRFLIGDNEVKKELERKKEKFDSPERELKNITFNRLYFNQYFRQRVRDGFPNIKYCNGGSRDFLFVYWHDRLDRMLKKENDDTTYQPRVKIGVERLFQQEKLNETQLHNILDAISFSMDLRSDILNVNKNGPDKGLTFLDNNTLLRLNKIRYVSPEIVFKKFDQSRKEINYLSNLVWEETINKLQCLRGVQFSKYFRQAYSSTSSIKERKSIDCEDTLLKIPLIWGVSESGQKEFFNYLSKRFLSTEDWATIGSIVCSPLCSSKILHSFGTGILKEKGYGYLLRVVARNKNTKKETLKNIVEDNRLEKRYTEVALAALNGGNKSANNQI